MLEHEEQAIIVAWFRETYPDHSRALRASMMGLKFTSRRQGSIQIAKAVGQGGVIGEADLAVLLPRGGFGCFLMEYKRDEDVKGASDDQLAYIRYHLEQGNCAAVCKGIEMAKLAISQYMAGAKPPLGDYTSQRDAAGVEP